MNGDPASRPRPIDRAGALRPDLIPLAAFLCDAEYDEARSVILDHAAAGAPLVELTRPTADGWRILEPGDREAAEAALALGRGAADPDQGGVS